MEKITINFKNLVEELENKELKLCFTKNKGDIYIEDAQMNLYAIETYYVKSYLDNLIKKETVVEFNRLDKSKSQNIADWEKEIWEISQVKEFIENHLL